MPEKTTTAAGPAAAARAVPVGPTAPAEAVTPLLRGVGVLQRLTEAGGTLSASGLERATGLARSTVDRRPSSNVCRGFHPSSRRTFAASIAYLRSWPGRSATNVFNAR